MAELKTKPTEASVEAREKLLQQIGKHRTGKVCLYIKRLSDIDVGVLKLVKASWPRCESGIRRESGA